MYSWGTKAMILFHVLSPGFGAMGIGRGMGGGVVFFRFVPDLTGEGGVTGGDVVREAPGERVRPGPLLGVRPPLPGVPLLGVRTGG